MSLSRASFAPLACAAFAVLAACGGGGGGSVTPPGGGNGGTPPPGSTPTPTSTPAPTATPTATPTPTSTGVVVDTGFTVSAGANVVNGTQSWYTSGVTVSWTPNPGSAGQNGDTSGGASAASGFVAMDGMPCAQTQEPAASAATYSTHAFVGIYYNGTEYALPQAIGMKNPTEPIVSGHPNDNYEVEAQTCEYNIHTHDYSGLIHVEDVNYPQSTSATSPLPYGPTLKSLLDLWGVQLSSTGMSVTGQGTLSGPVAIYHGTPGSDVGPHGAPVTDSYAPAASASDVSLGFHQTVWIVIGPMPTLSNGVTGLPQVEWRVQY